MTFMQDELVGNNTSDKVMNVTGLVINNVTFSEADYYCLTSLSVDDIIITIIVLTSVFPFSHRLDVSHEYDASRDPFPWSSLYSDTNLSYHLRHILAMSFCLYPYPRILPLSYFCKLTPSLFSPVMLGFETSTSRPKTGSLALAALASLTEA
jgi:hypothetical protein